MLERGKYGIEYDPRQRKPEASGLGWLFLAVGAVALLSLTWTIVGRVRSHIADDRERVELEAEVAEEVVRSVSHETKPVEPVVNQPEDSSVVADPVENLYKRPQKVRNLLLRLEEAERRRDVEMAVTTIESIRALPGSPAADIDDALARRLGVLNVRMLFRGRNSQWVKTVVVKRGDSASRIAYENGTTLRALACLNGGSVDHINVGQKLYVMNHPRFNLVIRRRPRIADLSLNGKLFRRYDLVGEVSGKDGVYELPSTLRSFWNSLGVTFKGSDRTEIETLMPAGAPVLVSEM